MMPGMWVVRPDGTPWQVSRITRGVRNAPGGLPVPISLYHLIDAPGSTMAYVEQWSRTATNADFLPTAPEQLTALPACSTCGTAAGWECDHITARAGQHTSEGDVA